MTAPTIVFKPGKLLFVLAQIACRVDKCFHDDLNFTWNNGYCFECTKYPECSQCSQVSQIDTHSHVTRFGRKEKLIEAYKTLFGGVKKVSFLVVGDCHSTL
jgi:hypothetical protein